MNFSKHSFICGAGLLFLCAILLIFDLKPLGTNNHILAIALGFSGSLELQLSGLYKRLDKLDGGET